MTRTTSRHRLRRGLPGYLILFAPHAFVPQRQSLTRWPPSPPVFLPISTHFTATQEILPPSSELEPTSSKCHSQVEPGAFRSEERRVGKECRSRWSPDHYKKNREND